MGDGGGRVAEIARRGLHLFLRVTLLVLLMVPRAAAREEPQAFAPSQKPALAILLFDYGGKDAALEPLREGLSQMLIAEFSGIEQLRVLERARLKEVIARLDVGRTAGFDVHTVARLGRLLGARFLIVGSYFDFKDSLRINARVVDVETGRILRVVGATGAVDDFWAIERNLAADLGRALARELPGRYPEEPTQPPPRVKSSTVAGYGRALGLLDAGKREEAAAALAALVKEAPQFSPAAEDLDRLRQ